MLKNLCFLSVIKNSLAYIYIYMLVNYILFFVFRWINEIISIVKKINSNFFVDFNNKDEYY